MSTVLVDGHMDTQRAGRGTMLCLDCEEKVKVKTKCVDGGLHMSTVKLLGEGGGKGLLSPNFPIFTVLVIIIHC